MKLVHAALLLHESGKEINEENIKGVLDAAGIDAEKSKIKALLASLEGVDIEEEITGAAVSAAPTEETGKEETEEKEEAEEEEEEGKSEEEAAEGLGELF